MILSAHQAQYLPWLGYFNKIAASDVFVFLDDVQYKGHEFQNRNKIRTKDSWMWLSVPVISRQGQRQMMAEAEIDNSSDWGHDHMLSIRSFYSRSGYFSRYFPFFEDLYKRRWDKLLDLNIFIIKYILKELSINTPFYFESGLGIRSVRTGRIIDLCVKFACDEYLSGSGGRDYLDETKFIPAGVKLLYQDYKHPVYRQQFMKSSDDFMPYMSAIDLLFNEGPSARKILLETVN